MSSTSHPNVMFGRSVAMLALLSGAILVSPLAPAWGQSTRTHASASETVGERIATLHAELKITPAEEQDWAGVAQTMRDNADAMQRIVAAKAAQSQQGMTALEDLQTYAQLAQQHVDGLKNLIASFSTLYNAMPDAQKKLADQVFMNAQRQQAANAE